MTAINRQFMLNIREVKRLYYLHPEGLLDSEVALLLRVNRATVWRMRRLMTNVIQPSPHHYTLTPSEEEREYIEAAMWRINYERERQH